MLNTLADLASILTAVVAAFAYGSFRLTGFKHRKALEKLLESKASEKGGNEAGSLTLPQLRAALNLSDEQIMMAAWRSKRIKSFEGTNGSHRFRHT